MINLPKMLLLLFTVVFLTGTLFSQEKTNRNERFTTSAGELTSSLQMHLSLSQQQSDEIREALYEYHEELLEDKHETESVIVEERREADNEETDRRIVEFEQERSDEREQLNSKIEDVLDENQIIRWNLIKEGWWGEVHSKLDGLKNTTKSRESAY